MIRKLLYSLGFITLSSCSTQASDAPEYTESNRSFSLSFEHFKSLPVEVQQDVCTTDTECEWAYGLPVSVAMSNNPEQLPQLVGLGCEGAGGPIYAFEEDHFPKCEAIEPVYLGG